MLLSEPQGSPDLSTPAPGRGHRPRPLRIALYSHDTMGLGHMRRNLLIATALRSSGLAPDVLLITGAHTTSAFDVPPGVDCLTLPSLFKRSDGSYGPRTLQLPIEDLVALRAQTILATLRAYDPDVLIVDNVPRGAMNELDPALQHLRAEGRTRCVLGLRDIIDEPTAVRRDWRRAGSEMAIRRYYDAVWIYGDRDVYDPVHEYRWPIDIARKTSFTGYLDPRSRRVPAGNAEGQLQAELGLSASRLVLCLVGGGQDGAGLAEAFSRTRLPEDTAGVVVTGPFMPAATRLALRRRAASTSRLRVVEFLAEPTVLLREADRVIAMGGYNTTCEILAFDRRALIMPRVTPRREQWIRAERLRARGLLETVHPDAISPRGLAAWLRQAPPATAVRRIDMNGLTRLESLLEALLEERQAVEQQR